MDRVADHMRAPMSVTTVGRHLVALGALGFAALAVTPASSCTTVCLLEKGRAVVAYNYDVHAPEGLVLVNKRGMRKVSSVRNQGATWTAAHGSVTFNQFGRDHPMTGLNEKGLTKYPPEDGRHAVGTSSGSSTTWIAMRAWRRWWPTRTRCAR